MTIQNEDNVQEMKQIKAKKILADK